MQRRTFLAAFAATTVLGPPLALSQAAKANRIALVSPGPVPNPATGDAAVLLGALKSRGYTIGQNLSFEPRGSLGKNELLPEIMHELKAHETSVVVTVGYPTAVAAKAAGLATVATAGTGDPVATGLVDSLARPGGVITGISDDVAMLSTKRLQLLKEVSPGLRRVAMLWNKDDLGMTLRYESSAQAARELGVTVQALGVREPNDFDEAFAAMNQEHPDAILMVSDTLTILNRKRVFEFAAARRMPAIYEADSFVREGGLMSYGPDRRETFERAAAFVDRILRGASPATLPFEEPTRYLFVINAKVANALGLTLSQAVLLRADDVVE